MEEKYLLYLDILGFSQMVAEGGYSRIDQIYKILDNLNVHRHPDFKAIVFSDTLIAYNDFEAKTEDHKQFAVMFLAEFAQDLLYRSIENEFSFRATIRKGHFADRSLKNIRAFYGPNLVDSYLAEKKINSIGLFIHDNCLSDNLIFPTVKYGNSYSFLIVNQALDRLTHFRKDLPVNYNDVYESDLWGVVQDVQFLKWIYAQSSGHENPLVRIKYLQAWQLYEKHFGKVLNRLIESNFELTAVCPSYDWKALIESWKNE